MPFIYVSFLSSPPLPLCVLGARRIYCHRVLFSLGLTNSLPEISFNQMGLCCGTESLTGPLFRSVLMAVGALTAAPCPQCPPPPPPRGTGGWGSFLPGICTPQSPHFTLCSLPLPVWGAGPVRPGPACLPGQIEKLENFPWQLKTRFRYPSCRGVSTLQIIACST